MTKDFVITIEQLAEAMGKKVYKGRIYLWDLGYNTKKTKCKVYIYATRRSFHAAAYITCTSQPEQWIKQEEKKLKALAMQRVSETFLRIRKL